jgi:hypothetical protein
VNDERASTSSEEENEMKVTTIDIDLAKRVFQVHGVDQYGKCILRRRLRRATFAEVATKVVSASTRRQGRPKEGKA